RLQRVEQANVLDGDGRLVGEGFYQRDLALRERLRPVVPLDRDDPEQLVGPEHGAREQTSKWEAAGPGIVVLRVGGDIGNVHGPPLERGAPRSAPAPERDGILLEELPVLGSEITSHRRPQDPPVEAPEETLGGPTKSDRVIDQRLGHGLEIERRSADHLEELAGRRLLLEGDPQLTVAALELLEEADVLDGDDRLVGEGT